MGKRKKGEDIHQFGCFASVVGRSEMRKKRREAVTGSPKAECACKLAVGSCEQKQVQGYFLA